MTTLLFLLLLHAPEDLGKLIEAGRYADAVAQAKTPDELFAAMRGKASKHVAGVVRQVAQLGGVLKRPAEAAAWCEKLGEHRKGDPDAMAAAGYLYLRAGQPAATVKAIRSARTKTGLGLAYLADAHRRLGQRKQAMDALEKAVVQKDAPRKFVQDVALSLATGMRAARDRAYADVLDKVGLSLRAALWLAEDLGYDRGAGERDKDRVRALFEKGLDDRAPATAWWTAAGLVEGDKRFTYLVEAVRRGADAREPGRHACPAALVDLARECAGRERYVAAAALARRRIEVGESPAAWAVLESLPPEVAKGG